MARLPSLRRIDDDGFSFAHVLVYTTRKQIFARIRYGIGASALKMRGNRPI
jgi:hypothetical protein